MPTRSGEASSVSPSASHLPQRGRLVNNHLRLQQNSRKQHSQFLWGEGAVTAIFQSAVRGTDPLGEDGFQTGLLLQAGLTGEQLVCRYLKYPCQSHKGLGRGFPPSLFIHPYGAGTDLQLCCQFCLTQTGMTPQRRDPWT